MFRKRTAAGGARQARGRRPQAKQRWWALGLVGLVPVSFLLCVWAWKPTVCAAQHLARGEGTSQPRVKVEHSGTLPNASAPTTGMLAWSSAEFPKHAGVSMSSIATHLSQRPLRDASFRTTRTQFGRVTEFLQSGEFPQTADPLGSATEQRNAEPGLKSHPESRQYASTFAAPTPDRNTAFPSSQAGANEHGRACAVCPAPTQLENQPSQTVRGSAPTGEVPVRSIPAERQLSEKRLLVGFDSDRSSEKPQPTSPSSGRDQVLYIKTPRRQLSELPAPNTPKDAPPSMLPTRTLFSGEGEQVTPQFPTFPQSPYQQLPQPRSTLPPEGTGNKGQQTERQRRETTRLPSAHQTETLPSTFPEGHPAEMGPLCGVPSPALLGSGDFLSSPFGPRFPGPRGITTDVEFLWWFFENMEVPVSLAVSDAGNLQHGFGFQDRPLSGARFTVGYLLDVDHDPVLPYVPPFRATGLELTGFFLAQRSIGFQADMSPTLFRPFFRLNDPQGSSFLVALPGIASGTISGEADIEMWGLEMNGWHNVFANGPGQTIRVDVMGGFRHLSFDANLAINSVSAFNDNLAAFPELLPFEGNRLAVQDVFRTSSRFYGPQVGFSLNYITSCFIASSEFKFGVGAIHQELIIEGSQARATPGGATTVSTGGLFALPSNIGTHERTKIGIVPEINVKFAFPLGQRCMFFFGYSFLGMSNAIWPGDQIDPVIDTSQLTNFPGGGGANPAAVRRPTASLVDDFIFIHGLNVGVRLFW